MKKKYLKPEAEYISLEAKDVITEDFIGGNMSAGEFDEW